MVIRKLNLASRPRRQQARTGVGPYYEIARVGKGDTLKCERSVSARIRDCDILDDATTIGIGSKIPKIDAHGGDGYMGHHTTRAKA